MYVYDLIKHKNINTLLFNINLNSINNWRQLYWNTNTYTILY